MRRYSDDEWDELNKPDPSTNYDFDVPKPERFPTSAFGDEYWRVLNFSEFERPVRLLKKVKNPKNKIQIAIVMFPFDQIKFYILRPIEDTYLHLKYNDEYYVLFLSQQFGTAESWGYKNPPQDYYIVDFEGNVRQGTDTRFMIAYKNKNNETRILK